MEFDISELKAPIVNINYHNIFIISDLHFGVRANSLEWLNNHLSFFYNFYIPYLKKTKIDNDILCILGDFFDNRQSLDITVLNKAIELVNELAKLIPIIFITGNHDYSFTKTVGISVGEDLAAAREDMEYLGDDIGSVYFEIPGTDKQCKVTLMHPGGGSAYALSYRPQKIVEQLEGGTKPHLLAIGHFHKAEFIPNYRNIAILQTGTFQSQTPFMASKGLSAMMGGWIVEAEILGDYNIFKTEFISFYHKV